MNAKPRRGPCPHSVHWVPGKMGTANLVVPKAALRLGSLGCPLAPVEKA